MKTVIIEDETIAAQALQRMLNEIRPDFQIETILQSVDECIEWFSNNPMPDLVFMDIHLADGSSFSIFEKISIDSPIIFTTAYNEFALEAFEVNSIDYILKPISKSRLNKAINKFETIGYKNNNNQIISQLVESLHENQTRKKTHFLIPFKDKLIPLAVTDIAYIQADMKTALAFTLKGESYPIDYSLEEIMRHLDHELFFRVNRQYIISHNAVKDISIWFTGKLALNLKVPVNERILVSKARVSDFKKWFTKDDV